MSDTDPLPPTPKGSALEGVIAAVGAIYDRIEADQRPFLAAAAGRGAPLRCPPGCGSCCEPFVPDILPAEAAYAAAWMHSSAPDLALESAGWRNRPAGPSCPFLERLEGGSRCAIYPARFLICRLFGASGTRDKEGRAAFRPCARMPLADRPAGGEGNPALTGGALVRAFGAEPPVMADYAAELLGLSPSEACERRGVMEALPPALVRVGLSLSLAERVACG
jgi:uncharacterized protein